MTLLGPLVSKMSVVTAYVAIAFVGAIVLGVYLATPRTARINQRPAAWRNPAAGRFHELMYRQPTPRVNENIFRRFPDATERTLCRSGAFLNRALTPLVGTRWNSIRANVAIWRLPKISAALRSLLNIRRERNPLFPRNVYLIGVREDIVIGRLYFVRQAATPLKFAQSTANPEPSAVL